MKQMLTVTSVNHNWNLTGCMHNEVTLLFILNYVRMYVCLCVCVCVCVCVLCQSVSIA